MKTKPTTLFVNPLNFVQACRGFRRRGAAALVAFGLAALAAPAGAAMLLQVDFQQTQNPHPTETGYQAFEVTNAGVAGPQTRAFGSYGVTVTNGYTVDGSGYLNATGLVNARYRAGNPPDSGAFTYSDLYTDFVTNGADTGLQLTGFDVNTAYTVTFYAFDYSNTRTQTFRDITGGTNVLLGSIAWTASTTPTSNGQYSLTATVTTDSLGRMTIRANGASGTTVINGLQVASIPEPSTVMLTGLGLVVVLRTCRRSRGSLAL
jgi:hypothetical protein